MIAPVWIALVGATLGTVVAALIFWSSNHPFKTKKASRLPRPDGQVYSVGEPSSVFWRRLKECKFKGAMWALIASFVATGTFAWAVWSADYANERWLTCRIDGKDYSSGSHYRLYTSCGVLENYNAWWRDKRNSPEMHISLKQGCTYQLRVAGSRGSGERPNVFEVRGTDVPCE